MRIHFSIVALVVISLLAELLLWQSPLTSTTLIGDGRIATSATWKYPYTVGCFKGNPVRLPRKRRLR
jgi:hypothetical protein